jgi:general secretion pathway protein M
MKAWWSQFFGNLNTRERHALCVGALGTVLYLAYMSYAALAAAVFENQKTLSEKKSTLIWMRQVKKQFVPSEKSKQALDASKALSIFSKTLKQASFDAASYQLQQMADGALQLSFESVAYQPFLHWLWSMEQRYSMDIKLFEVEKTKTPGLVKLSVTLVL